MIACVCGGILEVGLFTFIVTGVTSLLTWTFNRIRYERYKRQVDFDLYRRSIL